MRLASRISMLFLLVVISNNSNVDDAWELADRAR
jgi:hypothetical protein